MATLRARHLAGIAILALLLPTGPSAAQTNAPQATSEQIAALH